MYADAGLLLLPAFALIFLKGNIMQKTLETLIAGHDLTREQTYDIFNQIMTGQMDQIVMGAFLGALAAKGQTVDEIVGAAEAMREVSTPIRCAENCIDTCGTGGDGISTFNTSTTAAIVAAAAGATVAKHGSHTNSRASGSAEALKALGVNLEATPEVVEKSIEEIGIGFLYAVKLHPAMKYAAPVRRALGVQTIFNLLGPLTNPARAKRQVLGVNRKELVPVMAEALRKLGAVHALVVHGGDGLCDMTITTETTVAEVSPSSGSVSLPLPRRTSGSRQGSSMTC